MQLVLDYLKRNQSAAVKDLCAYLRFPSVSAQPQHRSDMQACAEWLAQYCRKIGLDARVCPTPGHPIVIAKTPPVKANGARTPCFLVYGHYDVQPPEPLELWKSPPFKPRVQGQNIFARGASDNKGQNLAHLKAVEAYLKTRTPLACKITFVIEGEEEVGSSSLAGFLKQHRAELACDAVVISDTGMPSPDHPALTYSLRGIAALEITLHGPSRDLHSGIFGGTVDNPAMALCQLLAKLRDKDGRVAIPDFYDDVRPLSHFERKQFKLLPHNERQYQRLLGVPKLFGENGYTAFEQRSARPTLEINGLTSGYQGEGSKTIVPSWARAKITMRLVPNQDPRPHRRWSAGTSRKFARRPSGSRSPAATARNLIWFRLPARTPRPLCGLSSWLSAALRSSCAKAARSPSSAFSRNPRRRLPHARPGFAGRQRPLPKRKIQPRPLLEGPVDERLSLAGTGQSLTRRQLHRSNSALSRSTGKPTTFV